MTLEQRHQTAVANYLAGRVKEYAYRLAELVDNCDTSQSENNNDAHIRVIYAFSALTNLVQTIKDAASTVGSQITWAEISQLPFGRFIKESRNAITHDGNPIINAWTDGKFFLANDIDRIDAFGNEINIVAPQEDIRALCLKFSKEFSTLLKNKFFTLQNKFYVGNLPEDQLVKFISNNVIIPDGIKQFILSSADDILAKISAAPPIDCIKLAIDELDKIAAYCDAVS